ncbi:MAG: hypothetical protein K2N63_09365 [Lachnospiraceae bacterium]|nr:hypothetical protein [Lachnospiraceae bacterium]
MKKLNITWEGIEDPTGYLFSFAKSLAVAVKNSPYSELFEDIVATSGVAFRRWVDRELCPSATSIWEFAAQKRWVENGGIECSYVERLWGEDAVKEERRIQAIAMIKESIDRGIAAVSWDISGCEWGVVTGYNEEEEILYTLKVDGSEAAVPYGQLGEMEMPILSVLTILGRMEKTQEEITKGMLNLARAHLNGEEWCDNAKGFAAYEALIAYVRDKLTAETKWNLMYYLGTYAALKFYALKYFEKYGLCEMAEKYRIVYGEWKAAFDRGGEGDLMEKSVREEIAGHLGHALQAEKEAFL